MNRSQSTEKKDNSGSIFNFLQLAGYKYWPASILPALVGTTLPFWLKPPGFTFKWFEAVLFLFATLLFHTGFTFLYTYFRGRTIKNLNRKRTIPAAIICLLLVILSGLYLNSILQLHENVHKYIFIVFIVAAFFTGVLYVAPPFIFFSRIGGELILSVGLGMLPVLGAYLIQVGDLTRTVYLASLPIVVSTGFWIWISKLISRSEDDKEGLNTMIMIFSDNFAFRIIPILIVVLIYIMMLLAVFGRPSLNPLALTALISSIMAVKIVSVLWKEHKNRDQLLKVRRYAGFIYLVVCITIILSSLISIIY